MTPDIIAALEAFAAYADPRRSVPASMPVTSGSSMARKQLTMGDCYAAADALAALSTSPAGQEVRDIVSWLRDQSEKGAEIGITKEKETFSRGVYAGGSLALKRAADMIESGKYRSDLTTPSVEPAGNVGLDLGAISSGHCYCWCHKSAGTIGCSPCCENEDNYLPPSKRDPALSSVEPAGNGREVLTRLREIAEERAQSIRSQCVDYCSGGCNCAQAADSAVEEMERLITALSSPPAADQEAVKCKRCNDTGWTIGNGTVREGCLSCDAQINMVRATPPAPASSGEGDELRHKLWMVISHASGGHLSKEDDSDRSINDICVEISRHHNRIWEQALEKGRQEATTSTERGR